MAFDLTRRHFFFGPLLAGAVPTGGFGSVPSLKDAGLQVAQRETEHRLHRRRRQGGQRHRRLRQRRTSSRSATWTKNAPRASSRSTRRPRSTKISARCSTKRARTSTPCIVTIPDFMHATAAIWCMERGKHVYVQKPLTRTIWEARQLLEAANKYKVATQMGNQGYSNEGTRQCRRDDLGRRDRQRDRSARLDRPSRLAARTDRDSRRRTPVPDTLDWDLWLGIAEKRPYTSGGTAIQSQLRQFLSAVQLARLLRFRLRRAGRHGVPHSGRAESGAATGRADQRGVHSEGRHQRLHVPEEIGHPLRFPGARLHAAGEDLLVRRAEGDAQDPGRAGGRDPGRSAREAASAAAGRRAAGGRRAFIPASSATSSTTRQFRGRPRTPPNAEVAALPTAACSSATRA